MQKKRIGIVIVLIIVVVGVIAALSLLVRQQPSTTIDQAIILPTDFQTAIGYTGDSLLLSNDRGLVTYDYKTGQAQAITPDDNMNGLSTVDSLAATSEGSYITFHQEVATQNSTLYKTLQQKNYDPTKDYWWLYDVQNKIFTPLPSGSLQATFDNNHLDVLSTSQQGEVITVYDVPTLNTLNMFHIPGITNFWPYNNGLLLQLADGSIGYTQDGIVVQSYFPHTTFLGGIVGNQAIGVVYTGADRQLVRLNLTTRSTHIISDKVSQNPITSSGGKVLYALNGGTDNLPENTYLVYDNQTGKKTVWKMSGAAGSLTSKTPADLQTVLSSSAAIVGSAHTGLKLVGHGLANVKDISSYQSTITTGGTTTYINYDSVANAVRVSSNITDQPAVRQAALQKLQADGYNPLLYSIVFTSGSAD